MRSAGSYRQVRATATGDHDMMLANRLIHETSPYLLQHARNPVDWRPWGPEAFEEAVRRDVPILVSIGYSTCYWCHVMERESFENPAVAEVMNRELVCVKLDREERPDVDDAYMAATLIMRGQGGWPMNCFLEPAGLRPFFCGTYFPPAPRGGMPGFAEVCARIGSAWRERRGEVLAQAEAMARAVAEQAGDEGPVDLGSAQVSEAVEMLLRMADRTNGGFGRAPKFPQPALLDFLLRVRPNAGDPETGAAIDAVVRRSLDAMACGGVRDQLAGGFHRYAVDTGWLVPHFEKMLYDNALLAGVYARAARLYDDDEYARIARSTCDWVLAEMTAPEGGFYSAQDAEVDHREGKNYLWRAEEVRAVLPGDDAGFALAVYGLDRGHNFQDPHHPGDPPANVLRLAARPEQLAHEHSMTPRAFHERLASVNAALLAHRRTRPGPHTDDKVITAWNGLMIAGLADAGSLLGEKRYIEAARRAAGFIADTLHEGAQLRRTWRRGAVGKARGVLEDSACFIAGLTALARAVDDPSELLDLASGLAWAALADFADPATGRLFDTPPGREDLFVRTSSLHDGAMPSGVSVMMHGLIDLAELTGEGRLADAAAGALRAHSARIARTPAGCVHSVHALFRLLTSRPGARATLAPGGEPARRDLSPLPVFTPVEIYADRDAVEVGERSPASIRLVVQVAPGYHLAAADPGPGGAAQSPFRVSIVHGSGVAAYADYPPGEAYRPSWAVESGPDPMLVYRGRFELAVALESTGPWKGRPLIAVTFQACTDTECLAPMTTELDVAIDRV
jgi:hypothetical protein